MFVSAGYTVYSNSEFTKKERNLLKQGYKLIETTEYQSYYRNYIGEVAEIYRKF